nr:scarecrow-like protein 18 [Tanacetum cinerariifolium]
MLSSSSINSHHNQDQEVDLPPDLLIFPPPPSPSIYFRQLLLSCAHSISHSDFTAAHRITTSLSANSSPYGDSTGDRLSMFAHSLGLRFRFFPLLLPRSTNNQTVDDVISHLSAVVLLPNEILAVNCVLYLHRLLTDREKLCLLLKKIKSMNPKVVTLAENEANHNHPLFISRFEEALNYYTAVFESLEATLPPNSHERMAVEQVWFGKEIEDIVTNEGDDRKERHERLLSWQVTMKKAGFRHVPLSPFALSQAKLLLRLHYPSEGYNLQVENDSFVLGAKMAPIAMSWLLYCTVGCVIGVL